MKSQTGQGLHSHKKHCNGDVGKPVGELIACEAGLHGPATLATQITNEPLTTGGYRVKGKGYKG